VWDEENVRATQEICRRIDGLPLAVELVAAATRVLEPRVLVEHVESSLDAPSSGRRDAPARQQTVRATIDWSYALLNERERDLFERLGAFAGSFTIEAAGAVTREDRLGVLSTLSALVDKSLLAHAASESETRFRMLQLVSEYAAERLAARADAEDVRKAHADYYVGLARAAHGGLRGREQRGWKDVFDLERENIRQALTQLAGEGRAEEAAEVVWSIWVYWLTGHFLEGRKLIAALLASPRALSEQAAARVRTVDGALAALLADLPTAHAQLGSAMEWFGGHDDDEGRASALCALGIATAPLDPDRGRELMHEGARLFADLGDAWGEGLVLGALGWLDTGRGDFTEDNLFERAYELARLVDDDVVTAHAATNLAELRLAQGRLDDARDALDVALRGHEAARLYDGLSYGLEAGAGIALDDGRFLDAARLLGASDGLRDEARVPIWGPRLTRFEALQDTLREALGEKAFDVAWTEGRMLGFDASLEAARTTLR
jgi:hypothetical protein